MKRKPISKFTASIVLAGTFGAVVFANWLRAGDASETDLAPATRPERFELARWGSGLPRTGQWRHGLVVIDFDGDGELDVVHGPARKAGNRAPQIFAGDGAGHFKPQTRFQFPKIAYDYGDVAVADFDGDGALDLALAAHLVGLAVLVRRGDSFEPYGTDIGLLGEVPVPPGSPLAGFSSRALEVADWNDDGRTDLIASSDGPRAFAALQVGPRPRSGIVVLLGKPGGFDAVFPATEIAGYGDSLAVGDLDPSPGPEILAASNVSGSKHVLYRTTAAGLSLTELPGAPEQRVVRTVAIAPGYALLGGLAMGEGGLEGSLDAIPFGAAAGAARRVFQGEPLRAVSGAGAGDLDADGLADVVIGDETGQLQRFESDGRGLLAREVIAPEQDVAGCAVYAIVFANLDRRPGDEIVVSRAGDDDDCVAGGRIEVYRLAKL